VTEQPKNKGGRPPFPPEQRRSARFAMRTFPDIVEKARRLGNAAIEQLIRDAKETRHR